MGTVFNLILYAQAEEEAKHLADAVWARVDSLNQIMSDYIPDSELNQLCATAGTGKKVRVSHDLWQVLDYSRFISRRSSGAFDVSIGPITRLWRRAMRKKALPDAKRLAEAKKAVNYRYIKMLKGQQIKLRKSNMKLDLGGIAKGYAVDQSYQLLRRKGIKHALVDGGGDIMMGDPPPNADGWKVEIPVLDGNGNITREVKTLSNCAVATSGDTYRYLEHQGVRYSHIVNPHTGLGMTDRRMVSVIAPTCMLADALASACSILPPPKAIKRTNLSDQGKKTQIRIIQQTKKGYIYFENI